MDSWSGRIIHSRGNGAGLVLKGSHGTKICYALNFGFNANNNEVEYKALIIDLKLVKDVGAAHIKIFLDSMLLI